MYDFYWIRHAECEMNTVIDGIIGGRSTQSPLTQRGMSQSIHLGTRFKREGLIFDEVYTSPAIRAYHTGHFASLESGFSIDNIIKEQDIVELSQGEWEGKPRDKIYTPEMLAHINADNWNFKPPGGESQREVEERALAWVKRTFLDRRSNESRKIGIYSHGVLIKCMLRGILGSDPSMTWKIDLENTSITHLYYGKNGWEVRKVNDYGHLP